MIHQLKRPVLSWPEWSKKPENKKLIKENIHAAKRKYNNDLYIAENYNRYLMYMMGLISTPGVSAPSGGGQTKAGISHYMIGQSTVDSDEFVVS
tara:strand:- start:21394 stop:21675 length:282 start_codon:yes stop_codon:yes gene_type:complete